MIKKIHKHTHKHKKKIDFSLVAGSLIIIVLAFFLLKPGMYYPKDGFVSGEPVLFSFKNTEAILIDTNPNFTSPKRIEVDDKLVMDFEPGVYYWKIDSVLSQEIRQFTIESRVELKLRKSEDGESYEVVNAGNVRLNVDVYDRGILTGRVVLDIDENKEVSGTKLIGRQDD